MPLTKLKLARIQSGLRQWDLAQLVGISESRLSKIETGRSKPSDPLLSKIAEALGVDAATLRGKPAAGGSNGAN